MHAHFSGQQPSCLDTVTNVASLRHEARAAPFDHAADVDCRGRQHGRPGNVVDVRGRSVSVCGGRGSSLRRRSMAGAMGRPGLEKTVPGNVSGVLVDLLDRLHNAEFVRH